jgi:hypothetical protein
MYVLSDISFPLYIIDWHIVRKQEVLKEVVSDISNSKRGPAIIASHYWILDLGSYSLR